MHLPSNRALGASGMIWALLKLIEYTPAETVSFVCDVQCLGGLERQQFSSERGSDHVHIGVKLRAGRMVHLRTQISHLPDSERRWLLLRW